MTDAPKVRLGRPRKPDALSAAERMAKHRTGRKTVTLPPETVADLAVIRARDGDETDVAAVARVLRKAAGRQP